jgi:hypothetical protein
MKVISEEGGRRVTVEEGGLTAVDGLEWVEALIEEKGWNPGKRTGKEILPSSQADGYTLHDAIGQFGTEFATAGAYKGGKDGVYTDPQTGAMAYIRNDMTRHVEAAIQETGFAKPKNFQGTVDQAFNDRAKDVSEVLAVVARAIELASEEV